MTGILRPPDWTEQAACNGLAGAELDPWHDERSPYAPVARQMCQGCPVRLPCALYALHEAIPHGIWGGLDPADRRRIARKHGYEQPGSARHATRSRYIAGCRCPDCTEAHRRYIASQRAKARDTPQVVVLDQPDGTGPHTAYPGQCVLFPLRPHPTGDTPRRKVVA